MAASEEIVDFGSLLEGGENAIVTLVAGETRVPVYRAVLASKSPVFKAMLQHDKPEVTVADVEGPVLRQLVAYLYTLRPPKVRGMATQLLLAACKFGLPGLKAECELQLAEQLMAENALDTAVLAKEHSCPTLTEAAINYIKGHTHRVMATQAWTDAVFHRPAVVVELSQLIAQPSVEIRNLPQEEKDRKLIQNAKDGSACELKRLLEAGADTSAKDGDKMTALHWAAERGHLEAVKHLLWHRAGVNARNSWRNTPLHLAAQNGHVAVVQELLKRYADRNAMGFEGRTPLHLAAQNGHVAVVQELLKASADHSARGPNGKTPLHYAAEYGHKDAVTALLDGGANKATKDDTGKTPLDYAKKSQQMLNELLT